MIPLAFASLPMLFNPFKYQFEATYLRDEGDSVILKIRRGTDESEIAFPKKLLPPQLQPGESTALMIEPQEALKQSEASIMKQLLEELVK